MFSGENNYLSEPPGKIDSPVNGSLYKPGLYFILITDVGSFIIQCNENFLNDIFSKLSVLYNRDGYTVDEVLVIYINFI
jgi:hypothetical protein